MDRILSLLLGDEVRRLVGYNEPVFAHLREQPLKVLLAVDHHAQIVPDEGN
jgi:hypothetical protein